MRIKVKGLSREKHGSGHRWRVRVEGDPKRKITIPVGPDHDDFQRHYRAARCGERIDAAPPPAAHGTMQWIMDSYLAHLERMVTAGQNSPLTLKERRNLATFVLSQRSDQKASFGRLYSGLPMTIPAGELMAFQHRMAATPGKARNVWKLLNAAFDLAVQLGHLQANPARAVPMPKYSSKGGATPWTIEDLQKYRRAHPPGTMAHLCLSLFMFTACRIGDAHRLGRKHEVTKAGAVWLSWQPGKRGSRAVEIPMLAPLHTAIRAQTVVGPAYLLTEHGKPFASAEGLRNRFKKWCLAAGLEDRSSHGIRKAAGHLMALHGATQYEIMAVHGHANASTSQVYTDTVERARLGEMAASKLSGLEW